MRKQLVAYTETVTEFFGRLRIPPMEGQPGLVEFQIEDDETYQLDLSQGTVAAEQQKTAPSVIVRARALDFMALIEGRMSFEDGMLTERLHVAGDMLKIHQLVGALKSAKPDGV